MPYFPVNEMQSADLAVADLQAAELFYTAAWGLEIAERHSQSLYLKASGNDRYVLGLHAAANGEPASILQVTFGAASVDELHRIAGLTAKAGGAVLQQPGPNSTGIEGGSAVVLRSPEGYVLRLVAEARKSQGGGARRGFPLRMSHVNLNCTDIDATTRFWQQVMGFQLTDRSAAMAFLRCNADHHAVVLADSGVDGLNHIAFLMPDFDSLMRGIGRMLDHGHPIGWGPGRHGPGDNIFAYFLDPFGIVIEHTSDVVQVDDSWVAKGPDHWKWPPGRTDQWGVAPPKLEAVKKAQLAIRFRGQ